LTACPYELTISACSLRRQVRGELPDCEQTAGGEYVSISRSGANKNYTMNWAQAFGKKKAAGGAPLTRPAGGSKKKAAPAKKKKGDK
jgi:hypothetical protein